MATGGDEVITHQPKSPSLEIDPDIKKMMDAFAKMGVKPKADTPEELTDWMMGFLKMKGKIKEEPEAKIDLQPPPIPSKPEEKVTKTVINHPPKIAWFSGTEIKAGDVTFEVWRHEVRVLMKQNYDKDAILNTVSSQGRYLNKRSLRGEAGMVAMRLDLDASVQEILQKLDSVYGSVEKKEELLAEFYSARQGTDESVTTWSCRLESILGKAKERGLVQPKDIDEMLRSMLWTGLRTSLKDISGHKYDTIKTFDALRVAIRQIEGDHLLRESSTSSKPHTSKAATEVKETPSEFEELKGMIHQLVNRMDTYEANKQHTPPWQQQQEHQQQQWQQQIPPWQQRQPWNGQPQQQRGRGKNYGQGQNRNQYNNTRQQPQRNNRDQFACWRCGQFGHRKADCNVRLDHSRKNLNWQQPMKGEHP
ncbi:uncharacterized protein LOC127707365 [Mytilus californianus]|uniref:uncharacterized protein LOC127707365 n=1 Tax=Mytilus californianus TaxID=6549 RepID=UPI002247DCEE|nr:uncharacterized protein LOC127707365 [Mytilus californianus]